MTAPTELEQLQKIATDPTREQVEPILRSDVMRKYRIDIESDSTIRGDLTRNQQTMNLFLQGTAQFMSAMAPIIQLQPEAIEPAVEVYTAFARQFKLGKQAEDALDKLGETARKAAQQASQPKEDPIAAAEKAKTEAVLKQKDQQFQQAESRATREHSETQQQSAVQFTQSEARAQREHAEKLQEQGAQHARTLDQTETHHALSSVAEEDRHKRTLEVGDKQFDRGEHSKKEEHERNRTATREDRHLDREDARTAHDRDTQAKEGDRNFEREKTGIPDIVKQAAQLADALAKIDERVAELSEELQAPIEAIRDAKGGIMAIRKGKRTMTVAKDANGRASGLQ